MLLTVIHTVSPAKAATTAYRRRERGAAYGTAASSTAPPKSMTRRVTFDPTWESIAQVRNTPRT